MPDYRVFFFGSDGHITRCVPFVCASDDEAVEHANQLYAQDQIELWRGAVHVDLGRDWVGLGPRKSLQSPTTK
jgi:hypothetical protein